MKLNTKLRKLRNLKKLSQAELADSLQISQTAYNKWESGTTKPSLDNILKLSRFYNIYIEELIDESPLRTSDISEKEIKIPEHFNSNYCKESFIILLYGAELWKRFCLTAITPPIGFMELLSVTKFPYLILLRSA